MSNTVRGQNQVSNGFGREGDEGCTPSGQKSLHFHIVFGENWPDSMLAHFSGLTPPLFEEILDLPMVTEPKGRRILSF